MEDKMAEKAVLSAIFQKGYLAYDEVADLINNATFTDTLNQIIYKCFEKIFKNDPDSIIDYPTLISTAIDLGFKTLEQPIETKYIRSLMNHPVESENVAKLGARIRTLEIRRQLLGITEDTRKQLIEADRGLGIEDVIGMVEKPIFDFTLLLNSRDEELAPLGRGLVDWVQHKIENPCENIGISTGLEHFDKAIGGGVRRKTINVIGARPKIGKTLLSDYFSMKIGGAQSIPVLILDTEMCVEDHWARMLASMTGVQTKLVETGKFGADPTLKDKVERASKKLADAPITYQSIPGKSVDQVISVMRRWIRKSVGFDENGRTKDCVIIYDYLKLVDSKDISSSMAEYQILGFMMTALHNFAHRYDVPIIAFVQLNRDGIEKESSDVVSQSDRIIWLCSNFSIFKPKTEEEIAEDGGRESGNRKLITILSRHGPGMEGNWLNLQLEKDITKIYPAKTQRQIYDDRNNYKETDIIVPF